MVDRRWAKIAEFRMLSRRFKDWMEARGIIFNSDATDINNHEMCEMCKSEGKAQFKCVLCNGIKPSSEQKESFGYPAEYLCTDCYNSVPAAAWDKKVDELEEEHRYDFE
jgi:hypothetical protein